MRSVIDNGKRALTRQKSPNGFDIADGLLGLCAMPPKQGQLERGLVGRCDQSLVEPGTQTHEDLRSHDLERALE